MVNLAYLAVHLPALSNVKLLPSATTEMFFQSGSESLPNTFCSDSSESKLSQDLQLANDIKTYPEIKKIKSKKKHSSDSQIII